MIPVPNVPSTYHELARVAIQRLVDGPRVGQKCSKYTPHQLVAVRHQGGGLDVARVVSDGGTYVRVRRFNVYTESWKPEEDAFRGDVLGVAE